MRIAFFHELHAGGARRSVNEFAKHLKKNHQVDLYIVDEKKSREEEKFFHKVYFYQFIPKKWKGNNAKEKLYKDTIELSNLYSLHKKIARDIDEKNYDLVFSDPSKMTQTPFVLRFLKTKKIYYCQEPLRIVYDKTLAIPKNISFIKYQYEKLNRFIRKTIDKSNIQKADIILANSKYTQANIKKAYGLESTVSLLGVDTHLFKPVKVKKDIDVLFVGSYNEGDGYGLLEQAKQYMKTKAIIKAHSSELQWITKDTGIRNLYCRAKIAVALGYNEPFGLIPLETMACEVPVVAVDEGGYKESVLDGKTGFLIPRDPKILAQKLDYLLQHPTIVKKMGKYARSEMISNWAWVFQAEKLEKHFKNFLKK